MLARPADAWDWLWALCRCGNATDVEIVDTQQISTLPWARLSAAEFECAAAARGYGIVGPWTLPADHDLFTDPAATLAWLLPEVSRGGDPRWRRAARAAVDLLATRSGHPQISRPHDGGVDQRSLAAMASLAALALYALADASALPVERVDLPTALRCGPEALHAHLAQVLPDAAAYGALQEQDKWRWRLDTWPYGNRHHDPVAPSSDPATVAWAYLAARAGLIPASNTPGYQHAYRQLTAVLAPAAAC
jgi:hypothetical protein